MPHILLRGRGLGSAAKGNPRPAATGPAPLQAPARVRSRCPRPIPPRYAVPPGRVHCRLKLQARSMQRREAKRQTHSPGGSARGPGIPPLRIPTTANNRRHAQEREATLQMHAPRDALCKPQPRGPPPEAPLSLSLGRLSRVPPQGTVSRDAPIGTPCRVGQRPRPGPCHVASLP